MKKLIVMVLCLFILCPGIGQSKRNKKDIIVTTMDLQRKYEIIGICQGFSLEMLETFANELNCDAVIGVRMVLFPAYMIDSKLYMKCAKENMKGNKPPAYLYYGTLVKFQKIG